MKFTKIIATMAAGVMLLSGCTADGSTVISAEGTKVTANDIAFLADIYCKEFEEMGQEADFVELRDQMAEDLENAVLVQEVAKKKDVELDEDMNMEYINQLASFRASFGGKTKFEEKVKEAGANEEAIELLWKSTYLTSALAEDEEFKVAEPTDEELKAYFKENYLRAKHVLITVGADVVTGDYEKSQAEDILKRAQAGEDFDALVEEFSQDPGSATNPDGYIFTEGDMVPEFEEGTKSIEPGEFTLIQSDYGYHVIQRLPIDESDEKFEELFAAEKENLTAPYKAEKLEKIIKEYAEKNGIKVEVDKEAILNITRPESAEEDEADKTDEE